jgi:serine/threonine protein kinase
MLYNINNTKKNYDTIKIADFGLAKEAPPDKLLFGVCGTPGYMAPEMVHFEGYGQKADVFSMGVILYILLCGFPPFGDDDFDWQFLSPEWDGISPGAKDLVTKMLKLKPSERPSIAECLQHEWLRTTDDRNMKEALEALRKFNARRRFRKGITAIRTTNYLKKIVALKSTSSQNEFTSLSEGPDDVGKYFRVYDDALSGSLKKLEACSAGADQMLKQLASNPELSNSMAPAMANIFKLMTLMEKDFKAFRKAYAQAYLPPAQADVADYL